MITFTQGNLLEARAEAMVNTVNTVGVMGKGIALMFKERFAENFRRYAAACKAKEVQTGKMFVTQVHELDGPRWIVNFPTKQHWRARSRMEWVVEGLQDLRRFLVEEQVKSVAIPPLGAGNGGLEWADVREQIERALGDLDIDILVFEPTKQYQNVAKRVGVEKLTPARALIAELVRRYWVLGMECSLLEIQKLAWFLERAIERYNPSDNPLDLKFVAHKYGPYANRLDHLLNNLDGSYLHSEKRISDADPLDVIWFDDERKAFVQTYLKSEAKAYTQALESTAALIDGFESPFGMELLATVDWLLAREGVAPNVPALREGLRHWRGGPDAAARKDRLFDDRVLCIALERLTQPATALA
ncbi:type II toxin-antitoxin system antitoxin DNA ADP-ribosyl glycohydrolase DarG [Pseudomonas aeruginosa]|uniref:type II toxin-antitoxin system antitoxin DNA ADP-ribosyl glycohydrolase DarG n=1 Tax=Pseudomonas aeruginosa TaxID=287 RepID=UPI00053EFD16|nr:macro domain-containing protein [Pseudomonas aeruginosa]WKD89641.1 macro domain-containing protein [Pseudomonas aeruginosa]HBO3155632.1 macro domain-containing protein [Pseudomonas aeruginosa]HCF1108657.1 macro domain-containing protein [Pseudomonas aeruginosa]HDY9676344.1 macro domain-containing protein [Pseudomonas aeruginosa]HEJ1119586.1 macro domain-containing protein [Pseudomonas aeruginosa]